MKVESLQFGSLAAYCPRPNANSQEELNSKGLMYALKNDRLVQTSSSESISMIDWVARTVREELATLPFGSFFQGKPILVPVPKSSLTKPDTLWVSDRLANAMAKEGLGKVVQMLERVRPIRKSAQSSSWERPKAAEHFETMGVIQTISEPVSIVLVDDIITRGATILGAANRLVDSYPNVMIRAFAAMRTQSNSFYYQRDNGPCIGTVSLDQYGESFRRP